MPLALAQVSAASVPIATSPPQSAFGDRGADTGDFSGYRLLTPLRLSLEGSVIAKASMFPNCVSREDAVGNSVGGIPVQHYAELRLTPKLVLSGFTQLGCPVDAGIGGVLTYTVPLRNSMQLVFGAGLYGAPGQLPFFGGLQTALLQGLGSASSPVNQAGRIDLVWTAKSGHRYNVGMEVLGTTRQAITFGGGF
ncbi:MAG: hypothetical protein M3O50_01050 [Myxococcota bacterium]|nr:hypothetical protein [Myxococcota bacterium]